MNSNYTTNKLEMEKRENRRKKNQEMFAEVKKTTENNEREFLRFRCKNAFSALLLLKWNENPDKLNEDKLLKENLILIHNIFKNLDFMLFFANFNKDDYNNLKNEYKTNSTTHFCWRKLESKFGNYFKIFLESSSISYSDCYCMALVIEIIEQELGKEIANKYKRTIQYEFGLIEELETFDINDYKEHWEVFIEYLRNNDCGYWADLVINLFENNFELSDEEKEKLRKRVVISRALSQHICYFEHVAPANEVASIIELSESFSANDTGKIIQYCKEKLWTLYYNRSIYEIIRTEMPRFINCDINSSIEWGVVFKMEKELLQILKILFPNFPKLFIAEIGNSLTFNPVSPKLLLNSLDKYKPITNEIIHFSSIEKLKSILKENTLRLYNTHNSDDKNELSNWLDNFKIKADYIKKETYTASFCDSKILNEVEKASVMWHEYGRDGEGISIKFKVNEDVNYHIRNNQREIVGFFLGKVSYEPIAKENLDKFINEFNNLCKKYRKNINILDSLIPFAYITKQAKFEFENEIRLFKTNYSSLLNFNKKHTEMVACDKHDEACNCKVKYYKVPLFKKEEGKVELIITEIQFGPNLSDCEYEQQKNEIENIFREAKINGDYPIPVFSRSTISETSYNEAIERHKQKSQIKETATLH